MQFYSLTDEVGLSESSLLQRSVITLFQFSDYEGEFPKPEMEIDVTPLLKKTRNRKRNNKNDDVSRQIGFIVTSITHIVFFVQLQNRGSPLNMRSRFAKRLKVVEKLFDVRCALSSP